MINNPPCGVERILCEFTATSESDPQRKSQRSEYEGLKEDLERQQGWRSRHDEAQPLPDSHGLEVAGDPDRPGTIDVQRLERFLLNLQAKGVIDGRRLVTTSPVVVGSSALNFQ
jgi:hypothetical protein